MKPLSPEFIQVPMGLGYFHEGFDREGKRIDGPAPTKVMVNKPQDELPCTRIILPQADSFLEGQSGIQDRDKALTSLGITQRTVSSILSP